MLKLLHGTLLNLLFIPLFVQLFLQWASLPTLCWLRQRLSHLWDHFLLAAVSTGASNHISIATAMHTAATVTNTRRTISPLTPSLKSDALEQMLGLTVRFSDVSHISLELGAVATAVCKHCKSSVRLGGGGRRIFFSTSSFLNHP